MRSLAPKKLLSTTKKMKTVAFGPGCVLPALLLVFLTTFVRVGRAQNQTDISAFKKCSIKDENGTRLDLQNLPPGVVYTSGKEKMECMRADSCRGWTIAGCAEVHCANRRACRTTNLISNNGVSCKSYASCEEAHIYHANDVICGMGSINACKWAIIEADDVIACYGPFACVSDFQDRITFRVGSKGVVRCNMGKGELSCQNIVVEVSHARRACIADLVQDESRFCGVICEDHGVCDKESILFRTE